MKPHHSIPKEGIYHDGLIEDCSDKRCNPRNMTRELDLSRQIPPRYVTDAEAEYVIWHQIQNREPITAEFSARLIATRAALLEGIQKAQEALADAHSELEGHISMEHCEDCTIAGAFLQNEALAEQIKGRRVE